MIRNRLSMWAVGIAAVAVTSCVPAETQRERAPDPTQQPDPNQPIEVPGVDTEAKLVAMVVTPSKTSVEVGDVVQFSVNGTFDDGTVTDVTAHVQWTSSESAKAAIDETGLATGLAVGEVTIRAQAESVEVTATLTVFDSVVLERIAISPDRPALSAGAQQQFTLTGTYSDGATQDLTAMAVWSSSNPATVTIDASGLARVVGSGSADITATFGELMASTSISISCTYPAGNHTIRLDGTMPPLRWSGAYENGSTMDFNLEDVHCGAQFPGATIAVFVVGAGWCTACPSYIRNIANQAQAIRDAGGIVVFAEAQNASYNPATNAYSNTYITNLVGANVGIRIGDGDTQPTARALYNAPLVTAFPSAFAVRLSDMKIIVDQARANSIIDFAAVARNPNGDWSNPNAPPFRNNCGATDEESFEPNDTAGAAAALQPSSFQGGICAPQPDYYRVALTGSWRLSLEFRHSVGDIDVYVWNEATGQALTRNGQKVGGYSATDNESFEHSGPALIRVEGYQNASSPYRLTLEAI